MKNHTYKNTMTISILCMISVLYAENYMTNEIVCIPWGEDVRQLGYIPGGITEEGTPGEMIWPGFGPKSWDVDTNGNIYITDFVKSRIAVYNKDGEFIRGIGIWYEKGDLQTIIGTSGRTYCLNKKLPFNNRSSTPMDNKFVYIKELGDVAVDSRGNVHVIEYPSGTKLFRFSPDGKIIKIIDVFGEYGQDDIREIGFDIRSNCFGHIIVGMITNQNKRIFMEFDKKEKIISIAQNKMVYRDANGNMYDYIVMNKVQYIPDDYDCVTFSVLNSDSTRLETLTVFLEESISDNVIFKGVDEVGNIYLRVDSEILKYDYYGNLLGKIQISIDGKRTFNTPMPSLAAVSKIMANGDIYDAYISDQGFVVVKYELQQETKGQILKPAYIPEGIKKDEK